MNSTRVPAPRTAPCFRKTLLAVSLAMLVPGLYAGAVRAEPVSVRIPAQSLGDALVRLGEQAHLQILFDPSLVQGRRAPALDGRMEPSAALDRLLQGTGLRHSQQDGTVTISDPARSGDDVLVSQAMTITGAAPLSAVGPDAGYVAKNSLTATKTDTPLGETPQSVSVVTRKQMDAQAVQDISQAVRYTPGIASDLLGSNNTRERFVIRGFSPYTYQDGLQLPYSDTAQGSMSEPYGLERVEVLRGPASMLYGQSRPGGLINLVSKRPTDVPLHEIQLKGGSHDLKQMGVDFGGPLDQDGKFSYRLTGLVRDSGTQVDHVDNDRDFIAPAFTWRPDEDTSLTLLALYQHDKGGTTEQYYPAYGSKWSAPFGHIDSDTFLGDPSWDKFDRETYQIGYLFERHLNDTWTFRQNLRWSKVATHNRSVFGNGWVDASVPSLSRFASDIKNNTQIFNVDNQAQAKFATGALEHTLLMGVDYRRTAFTNDTRTGAASAINPYDPVYGDGPATTRQTRDLYQTLKQTGIYLQDQIKYGGWIATLGGRYDWAKSDSHYRQTDLASDFSLTQDDEKDTWRAGLGYLFDNGVMPYVSYSESFDPVLNTSVTQTTFQPSEGKQWETGIKYQPPGQDSYVTASLFKLQQTNISTPDPANPTNTLQIGEAESNGFELEGKLALNDSLSLLASYAYTDTEITKTGSVTAASNEKGNELPYMPRHQASAWLDYAFHGGLLDGVGLGFGARYTGALWGSAYDSTNAAVQRIKTGNVTVFDAAARYDLGRLAPELKGADIALNASNLFDKTYVAACQGGSSCLYGPQRNLIATLTYRW